MLFLCLTPMVITSRIMNNWIEMNYLLKVRKSPNTYAGIVVPVTLLNMMMCFILGTLTKEIYMVSCTQMESI